MASNSPLKGYNSLFSADSQSCAASLPCIPVWAFNVRGTQARFSFIGTEPAAGGGDSAESLWAAAACCHSRRCSEWAPGRRLLPPSEGCGPAPKRPPGAASGDGLGTRWFQQDSGCGRLAWSAVNQALTSNSSRDRVMSPSPG